MVIKPNQQNIAKNIHNSSLRSEYRTMIKKVLSLVAEGKKDEATSQFRLAQKRMDSISSKGIVLNTIFPVFTQLFVCFGITVFRLFFEEKQKNKEHTGVYVDG